MKKITENDNHFMVIIMMLLSFFMFSGCSTKEIEKPVAVEEPPQHQVENQDEMYDIPAHDGIPEVAPISNNDVAITQPNISLPMFELSKIAGTPPERYPSGISESEKIHDMKQHLNSLNSVAPDVDVFSIIYLKNPIPYKELEALLDKYRFEVGKESTAQLHNKNIDSVLGVELNETNVSPTGMKMFLINVYGIPSNELEMDKMDITGLYVYGSIGSFHKLWLDRPETIRAIGVQGRKEEPVFHWQMYRSYEPLGRQ